MAKTKTSGGRGRPRASERTPEATRAQLIDAATKVFAEQGYHAATVDQMVGEAGLSKGTFYWHFESKDELFGALLEERIDRPASALMEITRTAPAQGATAPVVSHGLATLFNQQRELVLLLHEYWSAAVRDERLRARYLERQRVLREALAGAFIALAEGLSSEALLDPDSVEEGLFGEILSLVYDGMAARAGRGVPVSVPTSEP